MTITMELWEFLLAAFGPLLLGVGALLVSLVIKFPGLSGPMGGFPSIPPLPPISCPCSECHEYRMKKMHEAELARRPQP